MKLSFSFKLKEETTRRSEVETKSEMMEGKLKTYETEIEKLKDQVRISFTTISLQKRHETSFEIVFSHSRLFSLSNQF